MAADMENHSGEMTEEDKENGKCDKRYYCLYCDRGYAKIKQHLVFQHGTENEVAEMISKSGKEFEKHLLRLRNMGNHKHNCDVLTSNSGFLVVVYTPQEGPVKQNMQATTYHVLIVLATMRRNSFAGIARIAVYGSQIIVKRMTSTW